MRPWVIPFHSPEAGDRYDRTNEAAFRLEVQRALEGLPGSLDARYLLSTAMARIESLEQRVAALEDEINP